jgi:uncharacterized protein (DUF1330 family)
MSAYIVAVIDEHDSKVFEQYRQAALPVVTRYGGRSLLQGTQYITLEGEWAPGRVVVIEFPTSEAAQAFYNSPVYTESRRLRYQSSKTDMLLFEGRPA